MLLPLVVGALSAHAADPLLSEAFDAPGLPAGWSRIVGAQVGAGTSGTVAIEDGALALHVAAADASFPAIVHDVPVAGLSWVRVSARMRTDAVDPSAARFANCDLFLRFDGGPVGSLGILTGTQPWSTRTRILPVPAGAKTLQVGAFLSMPGSAWFDDIAVTPVEPGWRTETSGPYIFHVLPGDTVSDAGKARSLAAYTQDLAFFGLTTGPTVDYWKYPDNATKAAYTGEAGNGHSDGHAIYTIWPEDDHEIVHVLDAGWGQPPALFREGTAVWLSGSWQNEPVRTYAAGMLDRWIPLPTLLDSHAFVAADDLLTYAEAGALVGWILDTRGKAALQRVYATVSDHRPNAATHALEKALGEPLAAVDADVRAWVAKP